MGTSAGGGGGGAPAGGSGYHPIGPGSGSGPGPGSGASGSHLHPRTAQPLPSRTTKISEKLVLLPETTSTSDEDDTNEADINADADAEVKAAAASVAAAAAASASASSARRAHAVAAAHRSRLLELEDDFATPLRDEELDVLRKRGGIRGKSYAERLPKPRRAAEKVSRVTAYCTAEAFNVKEVAEFVRKRHEAKTKLYDDSLYTIYALPLLPGTDGFRLRSKPILRTPGASGKTVLDLEIERNEQSDHHEGYFDEYGYGATAHRGGDDEHAGGGQPHHGFHENDASYGSEILSPSGPINRLAPDAKNYAEMFVFSYGVVVFWNFTEHQEKDVLADLTFAGQCQQPNQGLHKHFHHKLQPTPAPLETVSTAPSPAPAPAPAPARALMTRPLSQEDFETEEFHFEYSADVARPRVFNDMITLLPRSDHMVKLTISHAIAQSTKLCFFEERMAETMLSAHGVPKTMAMSGQLNMERKEVLKMMGRLFKNRVDINLCKAYPLQGCPPPPPSHSPSILVRTALLQLTPHPASNILDVPDFFWDSEPILHPLYVAIRDYLEIDPRIRVLNERCRVFLDLSEILSDSIADSKMSLITWIIIVLIVISIVIEAFEIVLRTSILKRGGATPPPLLVTGLPPNDTTTLFTSAAATTTTTTTTTVPRIREQLAIVRQSLARELPDNVSLDDLRRWARLLADSEGEHVCGQDFIDASVGLGG